jgi:DNA-binding transcriptional regulator GbsR (MarR family)
MTLSQLVRDLGVSKASVSTDARRLERQGIVERVRLPGDRKAYYRAASDLPAAIMRLRIDRIVRFNRLLDRALEGRQEAGVRTRLDELSRAHGYMLAAMESMLAGWEPGGAQAAPGGRSRTKSTAE